MPTKDEVVEALREVEDPELGMDIVELGLMYDVEIEGPHVKVIHSLTSIGCPAGPMIQEGIHDAAATVPGRLQPGIVKTTFPSCSPDSRRSWAARVSDSGNTWSITGRARPVRTSS